MYSQEILLIPILIIACHLSI